MTEARSCRDQHVVVIGGANSAGQAAVYFASYAHRVTILVRGARSSDSMSHYLIEQIGDAAQHRGPHGHHRDRSARATVASRSPARRAGPTARRTCRRTRASSSSARGRAPTGSRRRRARRARLHPRRPRRARTRAGRCRASPTCWRPPCPASSWPATCARGRSSASRARSARARCPCRSSTSTWSTDDCRDDRPSCAAVDLFDELDDDALAEFAAATRRARRRGRRRSSPSRAVDVAGLQLLLDGRCRSFMMDGDRAEPVGHQHAPTWMGAIGALTGDPLPVRMQAESDCRIGAHRVRGVPPPRARASDACTSA